MCMIVKQAIQKICDDDHKCCNFDAITVPLGSEEQRRSVGPGVARFLSWGAT